jgi:hypothetical protein
MGQKIKNKFIVMTQSNTIVAKASVAFVAIAMSLMMIAPAKAATAEEMQAQIDALMATIKSLQTSMGTTPAATPTGAAYVFTRSLTIGSQGADVTALQTYLIAKGHAIAAGATGYFGAQTAAAVAAWQTANGISPAAGYFGPVSQAKYAALMAATPTTPTTPTTPGTPSTPSDLSGEASLDVVEINDADDSDVEEGASEAELAEVDVEFTDGDAMITRLDIVLDKSGQDPWDVFGDVMLMVDGEEVGTIDASDEDNYLDEDDGSLRFSGLEIVANEDEEMTITIAAEIQNNLDVADKGDWNIYVAEMRFIDADDVTTTESDTDDLEDGDNASLSGNKAVVTVEDEGADDEVLVKAATTDPDATTIQVEDDSKSDFTTIFEFDLDTDDSTNDVEVNEIVVTVASTEDGTVSTTTNKLINDAMLVVDGEEFDDVSIDVTGNIFTFNIDGDLVIDAGDRVTVAFQAEFKALPASLEGATVQATITGSTGVDSEGADDITASGAATGEEHTLRTTGANLDVTEISETLKLNSDAVTTDDEGVFTIEFDVTAFEQDLYVNDEALRGTAFTSGVTTAGANYIVTAAGVASTTGSVVATLDSEATLTGGRFLVSEGETETFTLTVEFDPAGAGGSYKVQLYGLNFAETNAIATDQQLATPAEDFDTDSLTI